MPGFREDPDTVTGQEQSMSDGWQLAPYHRRERKIKDLGVGGRLEQMVRVGRGKRQ